MALTGVLRPAYFQMRVFDMQASIEFYTKRIGFFQVAEGSDGRVYLKSQDEFDHHSLILRRADTPGIDFMGFKVKHDAELDMFEKKISEWGYPVDHIPAGEQPGLGRRIGWTIESGHRIELVADSQMSDPHPTIHNPNVWVREPHGMKARRLDHALLFGPNIDRNVEFFTKVLGFECAERVDTPDGTLAVWLSCGMKAHDVAFVNIPEPNKLHHLAFELENWQAVGDAADIMTHYDISVDLGPTRHGITRGQTIYFFDPSGNRCEVFAGGYTYYPDHPTRMWDADNLGKGIFYYERQLNEAFLAVYT